MTEPTSPESDDDMRRAIAEVPKLRPDDLARVAGLLRFTVPRHRHSDSPPAESSPSDDGDQ